MYAFSIISIRDFSVYVVYIGTLNTNGQRALILTVMVLASSSVLFFVRNEKTSLLDIDYIML